MFFNVPVMISSITQICAKPSSFSTSRVPSQTAHSVAAKLEPENKRNRVTKPITFFTAGTSCDADYVVNCHATFLSLRPASRQKGFSLKHARFKFIAIGSLGQQEEISICVRTSSNRYYITVELLVLLVLFFRSAEI